MSQDVHTWYCRNVRGSQTSSNRAKAFQQGQRRSNKTKTFQHVIMSKNNAKSILSSKGRKNISTISKTFRNSDKGLACPARMAKAKNIPLRQVKTLRNTKQVENIRGVPRTFQQAQNQTFHRGHSPSRMPKALTRPEPEVKEQKPFGNGKLFEGCQKVFSQEGQRHSKSRMNAKIIQEGPETGGKVQNLRAMPKPFQQDQNHRKAFKWGQVRRKFLRGAKPGRKSVIGARRMPKPYNRGSKSRSAERHSKSSKNFLPSRPKKF